MEEQSGRSRERRVAKNQFARRRARNLGGPDAGTPRPAMTIFFLLNKKLRGSAATRDSLFILPRLSRVLLHFNGDTRIADDTLRDGTLQNAEDHGFFDPMHVGMILLRALCYGDGQAVFAGSKERQLEDELSCKIFARTHAP